MTLIFNHTHLHVRDTILKLLNFYKFNSPYLGVRLLFENKHFFKITSDCMQYLTKNNSQNKPENLSKTFLIPIKVFMVIPPVTFTWQNNSL